MWYWLRQTIRHLSPACEWFENGMVFKQMQCYAMLFNGFQNKYDFYWHICINYTHYYMTELSIVASNPVNQVRIYRNMTGKSSN